MALLGNAALAMWWDMAPEVRADFEDWHSHEHFPERLGIPGFRRGSRWRSATGGDGFFILYELDAHETLSSPHYLARLNHPTPWSTRMMPHHRNMVRSQCRVLASSGSGVAAHALTVRLSPALGRADALRQGLVDMAATWAMRPGFTGAHLLRHEAPSIATTTEQKIRGNDQFADWVYVVCGYGLDDLRSLLHTELAEASLQALGAVPGAVSDLYELSHSAVPADVA
jgi:hypothetical protein